MRTKSGTILMYNCSGGKYFKLQQIFAMLRLRMRVVTPEQYDITLDQLSEGKGEPVDEAGEAIPETMLVFCGIGEALLNQVLEVIRVAKLPPISLKAVLTETNKDWTTKQLYEELCREREEFAMQTGEE